MNEEDILPGLIDSIYDATIQPELYEKFLLRLSEAVRGKWTMLMAHDLRAWRLSICLSIGLDATTLERVSTCFATRNPFIAPGRQLMRDGTVVAGEMILTDSELMRSEYYSELPAPYDLHYMISTTITFDHCSATVICSVRPQSFGPFGEAELQLFQKLAPHLRRALEIQQKLAFMEAEREAWDRVPVGCLLLGRSARVLLVNRAAEDMFVRKDGLVYSAGQLSARLPGPASQLRALISTATSDRLVSGGSVAVPRSTDEAPYVILVAPLPRKQLDWGGHSPVAIVFITDPAAQPGIDSALGQLYGLTPAELRLTQALMNGGGLRHAADELSISANTAKTHLQHIFSKTQTKRQAELIRLLAATPLLKAA